VEWEREATWEDEHKQMGTRALHHWAHVDTRTFARLNTTRYKLARPLSFNPRCAYVAQASLFGSGKQPLVCKGLPPLSGSRQTLGQLQAPPLPPSAAAAAVAAAAEAGAVRIGGRGRGRERGRKRGQRQALCGQ
jgi:hypothetical protein